MIGEVNKSLIKSQKTDNLSTILKGLEKRNISKGKRRNLNNIKNTIKIKLKSQ